MADHLETTLRELGTRLDVPAPPDTEALTESVLARLDDPTRPRVLVKVAAVLAALLLVLGIATAVSPTVRATVFDLLRIGDVEIIDAPAPPEPSTVAPLPGERAVSLTEARSAAAFPLLVPAALGDPDSVIISDGAPPRVVSFGYADIRIDQFDGGLSPVFTKFTSAADVRQVRIGDTDGVWIPRPHQVIYVDRNGTSQEKSARLAATTLIWTEHGVTYRIEGRLTEQEAVAIAESMR